MKSIKKLWLYAIALSVLASCADDSKLPFETSKPQSIVEFEYLKSYDVLKSYVDRGENPDFKLGAGVSVSGFTQKGVEYSMIVSNFDEVTAGWEMKHGGVVQDDGSLNLANVTSFITTAQAANISIYGHTLAWHANQNAKYLNSTIAPLVIPGGGEPTWQVISSADFETDDESNFRVSDANADMSFTADGTGADGTGRALKITNTDVRTNDYESQLFVTFAPETQVGEKYILTMDVRADVAAGYPTQAHIVPTQYKHWDFFGSISATTTWTTYTKEVTISAETSGVTAIAFNLGATATSYYFDNITVSKLNEGGGPTWNDISVADFETDNESNYQSNTFAEKSFTTGSDGTGRALKITNAAVRTNDWDAQFFVTFAPATQVGEQYILSMDVRADNPATYPTQAHIVPTQYKHWDFFGSISATTEWVTYVKEITITAETSGTTAIAFNLGHTATSYYFDNIKVSKLSEGGEQIIPKTPEEKTEIIHGELERWIAGMMEVSKEYVKAWDVVNEPMDDGNPYELKTGVGRDLADDEFYWQDYLGKDYGVEAFKLAEQYGNSDDILFINDYNLEYNLDKCKGLIEYAEYIESQGGRVDGIGTQMHISTNSDKQKIVEMFELLAATGKLIKISELDLGLEGGKKTGDATDEDYIAQAEMYQFVFEKYFEIIPASQRYGITLWSPRDSPASSSWRAGEPIGIWTEGYLRKRAYGTIADALGN